MPTSGDSSDDQESGATVWIFEWYPVATKYPWTVQTKTGRLVCLVSSTLILDAEKRFHLMMRRRVRPFFYVIVFNRCPCSPWGRLLLSQIRQRTYGTLPILKISFWESPRPDNRTIVSIITGRILVDMIATLAWDGNLHTATAYSWIRSTQINNTAFGAIGEIWSTKMEDLPGQDNSDGRPYKFIEGHQRSFK